MILQAFFHSGQTKRFDNGLQRRKIGIYQSFCVNMISLISLTQFRLTCRNSRDSFETMWAYRRRLEFERFSQQNCISPVKVMGMIEELESYRDEWRKNPLPNLIKKHFDKILKSNQNQII